MLQALQDFFNSDSLAPHGICLLWRQELVWLHVISDSIIVIAYYSIPIVLISFIRRRPDVGFGWVFWCFAAFILACGTTHLAAIWTLWRPDYAAEGLIKAATASASIATAGALWPLLPTVLKIPSPAQLRGINHELTLRIAERDAALARLQREIAEREQAEAMLRQAQKMEALGQLTAGVAHDFNNLLSVVTLNLGRLERDVAPGSRAERARATALEASRRAAQLTAQMLTYARQRPFHTSSVELQAFLRSIERLAKDALGADRALVVEAGGEQLHAVVDDSELTSALINLVVNARDASPPERPVRIGLERGALEDGSPAAVLTVADEGSGMSQEVLSRAFDPFFTTKDTGRGSGLGLSQVYGFARGSGGTVRIESEPGRGTRVHIALPLEGGAA